MQKKNTVEYPVPYEVWLVAMTNHSVINGCRPVAIVGCDEQSGLVTVVPFSTQLTYPQKPTHFLIQGHGLDCFSRGLVEHITTLPRHVLLRRLGFLDEPFDRLALQHALLFHFGLVD